MLQVTPQMRILLAVAPADFRRGIDGLARMCREALGEDPMSGVVFGFRNRRASGVKLLVYSGHGFWLCHLRLSTGRLGWWPQAGAGKAAHALASHELGVLLAGGDPRRAAGLPVWRRVDGMGAAAAAPA
jgi:transposase